MFYELDLINSRLYISIIYILLEHWAQVSEISVHHHWRAIINE